MQFAVFNGAIGYRHEGWTLTLWGKNLFDEAYEKRVFFFDNFHPLMTDSFWAATVDGPSERA